MSETQTSHATVDADRSDLLSVDVAREMQRLSAGLAEVAGDEARLEAEVLLAHALGTDRAHLFARMKDALLRAERATIDALLARRLSREPLAYVIGRREFYGIEIACAPGALIPRPESEMLVEFALGEVRSRGGSANVIDVGTGTGAISIAVAAHAPEALVLASDVHDEALRLARANARAAGVEVAFVRASMLAGLGRLDIVVANLPYVSAGDWRGLAPEVRDHEPRTALVGGEMGTELVEELLRQAPAHLLPGGVLAAEVGATQADEVVACARVAFADAEISIHRDLAGLDRVLVVRT